MCSRQSLSETFHNDPVELIVEKRRAESAVTEGPRSRTRRRALLDATLSSSESSTEIGSALNVPAPALVASVSFVVFSIVRQALLSRHCPRSSCPPFPHDSRQVLHVAVSIRALTLIKRQGGQKSKAHQSSPELCEEGML